MTVLRCSLAMMLLCGMSAQARDPVITVTKSEYAPGGARYYFVVSSWGYELMDSPCSSNDPLFTLCTVYLDVRDGSYRYYPVANYSTWDVPVRRNSYMGDLLKDLIQKGFQIPLSGSVFVDQKYLSSKLCIGFAAARVGPTIGGGRSPFGPCSSVAPLPLQCDITGNAIIDYKTLADNAVDGATASTQLNLKCRSHASVNVSTSRTDNNGVLLKDDGSLYSKITVNGKDATAGINVPITQDLATPLTITSTLVKRGNVTPGQFSGSTVVTISPP